MALPSTPGNPIAGASETDAYPAPAQRPGAPGAESNAAPAGVLLTPHLLGILLMLAAVGVVGFIVLFCGVLVFENGFVMLAGLILMNLYVWPSALIGLYLIVKAVRKIYAARAKPAS